VVLSPAKLWKNKSLKEGKIISRVTLDLDKIRADVASGDLKGVGVIEHDEVLEGIRNSDVPPGVKTYLLNCATGDKEVLVKSLIPSCFIQVKVR